MGLTLDKLFMILVIALIIVGPDRLPTYAKKLGELVRNLKSMATGAKDRMRDEMGPEFEDVDWKKLDPRQYDPRRIIRDALLEDEDTPEARQQRAAAASAARRRKPPQDPAAQPAPADPAHDGYAGSWANASAAAATVSTPQADAPSAAPAQPNAAPAPASPAAEPAAPLADSAAAPLANLTAEPQVADLAYDSEAT